MPKVSVIIPCFNQGEFLGEAVESVLAQKYTDLEMIIINDGSDDKETLRVLDSLSLDGAKIIHTENQGLPRALNRGVTESEANYILPLDADDKIASTYVAKAVEVLESDKDAGIVYCQAELFGDFTGRWELPEYRFPDILLGNVIFNSSMFRKSDWKKVNGYNPNMRLGLQDFDFWLSLIGLGRRVVCIPEVLFFYRKHPDSKSRRIGHRELVSLYAQLFRNHEDLYSNSIESVFEHIIALREQSDQKAHRIQSLSEEVAQKEATIGWLSAQARDNDKVIAARDEAVVYLSKQIADQPSVLDASERTIARLKNEVDASRAAHHRAAVALEPLRAGLTEANERLAAQLADNEREVERLAAHGEMISAELERVRGQLGEKREAAERLSGKLEETIRHRDRAINRLQQELGASLKKARELAASNELVASQVSQKEQQRQAAAWELAEKAKQLDLIQRSLGWRLLSLYGPIKYRYLLPLYRALGLAPVESRRESAAAQSDALTPGGTAQPVDLPKDSNKGEQRPRPPVSAPQTGGTGEGEFKPSDFYGSLTLLPGNREDETEAIITRQPPAGPLRRSDVICFSIIDWEFRYQRPQQIMSQFAANGHRVFYISTSRFQAPTVTPQALVRKIKDNLYEVQLSAERPPDVYGEVIDGNSEAILESLGELRRAFQINEAVAYVMIASWGEIALEATRLWNWLVVYDCMDEWENFPGIKRELLDMEVKLVERCDLLVVTAQRLYDKWRSYQRPTVLVRNAVDYDFYAENYRPNRKLQDIKHPIVGYYGAIADWFDVELVAFAARERPSYHFVLLGGVFDVDLAPLEKLPNVSLLGQQPYETMPQYLYHFDACIIPFKLNAITEATDPVKLYEYLSAGKPVVSVALPELEPFRGCLYIAEDRHQFVAQLDQSLEEDDRALADARRELARANTWRARYKLIADGLRDSTPRASIVVVTYNNLALTKLCLESIIRNTEYPNYEVIVVDNASSDGTPGYLRYLAAQDSNIHIILNSENAGFARANNQGIARSAGGYIVLLNNDTIVPPGWLSRLLRHLRNPAVGIVGPLTNFVGNEARIDVTYETWGEMEHFARERTWARDGQTADIDMLAMFCVALRRETYDVVGPLDEQFGVGMFEDDDYTQRMRSKGYRVVCAGDVFVHHFGQAAFKKLIERGEYDVLFNENRRRYEAKWNVIWTPHKHAPLAFEPLAASEPALQPMEEREWQTSAPVLKSK